MNRNIEFYLKSYDMLSSDQCKFVLDSIKDENWVQHTYLNPKTQIVQPQNDEKELDIVHSSNQECNELIMKTIWDVLHKYVDEFQFSWWGTWTGYSHVRFNRYKENQIMSNHCDHIYSLFKGFPRGVPILTILGSLNDDYEGGEFVMWGDTVIPFKAGEIKVFPSNFLYPHRVEPVIKGTRYSFVSWAY